MVVFGAGASYDSVPSRPPNRYTMEFRPPLSDELFADRPLFVDAVSRFERCLPIVPLLRHIADGDSLEAVLGRLQAEVGEYPERPKQLAAVRFYLHFVIWECERHWDDTAKGVTNYKSLLDQIRRWQKSGQETCLVTFNYDRLLEHVLPSIGITVSNIDDYVGHAGFKVVKLHGSVDWAREVDSPIDDVGNRNTWQVGQELIDRAAEIKVSDRFHMVTEHPIGKLGNRAAFPAIAIPLERKDTFECPSAQLAVLTDFIPKVTKILVIGWKAMDQSFLSLLREHLNGGVFVMTVAGSEEGSRAVAERLNSGGIRGEILPYKGGFTDLVIGRGADDLLQR